MDAELRCFKCRGGIMRPVVRLETDTMSGAVLATHENVQCTQCGFERAAEPLEEALRRSIAQATPK